MFARFLFICPRQFGRTSLVISGSTSHTTAVVCSPCLKLKPVSKGKKAGYLMANVEPYGGGLWHTWFDRDLTVAGRVIVRQQGKLLHRLVSPAPFSVGGLGLRGEGVGVVWVRGGFRGC